MSYYSHNNSSSNQSANFTTHIKLRDPKKQPLDSVSVIVHDPNRVDLHGFIAASWDGSIRYYHIEQRNIEELEMSYCRFFQHPVVSVCFGLDTIVFAGLTTGEIYAVDMAKDQSVLVGLHQKTPICQLFWIEKFGLLGSLGYDCKMKFWSLEKTDGKPVKQFELPSKTHTACFDFPILMIGTVDCKIMIIDMIKLPNIYIPNANELIELIEMGSKFKCCKLDMRTKVFTFGCLDGRSIFGCLQEGRDGFRVCLDTNKRTTSKSMKRQTTGYGNSTNFLYGQVNDIDIGYYNNQQIYAISGTQQASFYNLLKREKSKRVKAKITAGKLSLDGNYFMYAEGNDWCEGINDFKKCTKPHIEAVKFTASEKDAFKK